MNENRRDKERGQSLVLVAAAMVALVMFVAVAVDLGNAYYARRTAQNAADGAALAGVSVMATGINKKDPKLDGDIKAEMNEFAERNGIKDTNGNPGDGENTNVEGWYVDVHGNRLPGEPKVGAQEKNYVPAGAYGVEAITHITPTAFFGGIFGVDGYPLQARAVSQLRLACSSDCVVPITTDIQNLLDEYGNTEVGTCFNIWMENQKENEEITPGLFGWVNWTWQQSMCSDPDYGDGRPCPYVDQKENGCDADTLPDNLNPGACASGFVQVGDWMNSTAGVKNADNARCWLSYYVGFVDPDLKKVCADGEPHSFTIPVYDITTLTVHPDVNPVPCNAMSQPYDPYYWPDSDGKKYSDGLHYRVAGFARMQILQYQLSGGNPVPETLDFDPSVECITTGVEPDDGFRITAEFIEWVDDVNASSECYDPFGTLWSSPKLTE